LGSAFFFAPLFSDPSSNVLATSPDGGTVLLRQSDDIAQICDAKSQKPRGDPIHHDAKLWAAAFAADGDTLVTGGQDQQLRLWTVESGKPVRTIRHGGIVRAVAFSHSGGWIISGSSDQTAIVWNTQTGAPEGEPMQHPSELRKVAFSPDDRLVLTVCSDGSAWLWEAGSCKLVERPLQYETGTRGASVAVVDGTFNFDGSAILFQCADGIVRPYGLPRQLPDDSKLVDAWAKAHSAFESDNSGSLRRLSPSEWLAAQGELTVLLKSR
jgi:WD40 repeat protein